ncbi:MAG: imidazole glycerol phosphate synthase subunit HisH [Pseudobacteriovorax sp.]|nr:imidazole glycerol phosphate synthase subunit HisH [Pseudobacteriovorax sp.]
MIAIVDIGGSNLMSVKNAFDRLDVKTTITNDADKIQKASKVVFPGVGAAKPAMSRVHELELAQVMKGLTQPTLGVCLGMQLLFTHSSEADTSCLDIVPGNVTAIPVKEDLPIPHMGWNSLLISKTDSLLLTGIQEGDQVYFVHSFQAEFDQHTSAYCQYGSKIPAVVEKGNFFGTQFHPEKSADIGQKIIRNFLSL